MIFYLKFYFQTLSIYYWFECIPSDSIEQEAVIIKSGLKLIIDYFNVNKPKPYVFISNVIPIAQHAKIA